MKYFNEFATKVVRDVADLMGYTLVKVEPDGNAMKGTLALDEGYIKAFVYDDDKLRIVVAVEYEETRVLDLEILPRHDEEEPRLTRVKSSAEYRVKGEPVSGKQLTDKQLERQEFVDNTIFSVLQALTGLNIQWDIEVVGEVRDAIERVAKNRLGIPEYQFYPRVEADQ